MLRGLSMIGLVSICCVGTMFAVAGKLESHEKFAENKVVQTKIKQTIALMPIHSYNLPLSLQKFEFQPVSFYMETGSLRANIERIAKNFGWYNIVWGVQNDYHWLGRTRIKGSNLSLAFANMLRHYPLQATFYQGNHVLVIGPRTLKERFE